MVTDRTRQVVVLYSNNLTRICLCGLSIGRFTEVVIWTGFTVMLWVNWIQMFKCIISHSSTKSLVPPLHKFTIRKLDLFFPFFGKLNLLDIAVYLLMKKACLKQPLQNFILRRNAEKTYGKIHKNKCHSGYIFTLLLIYNAKFV